MILLVCLHSTSFLTQLFEPALPLVGLERIVDVVVFFCIEMKLAVVAAS